MNAKAKMLLCLALLPWYAGCGPGASRTPDGSHTSASAAAQDTAEAARDTVATKQQAFDSQAIGFMPMMWMHLDSMAQWSPSQIKERMNAHRQMAGRMMQMMGPRGMMGGGTGMGPEMTGGGRGMGRGAPWRALGDSIQNDLSAMPGLSGRDLSSRWQGHIGRMRRMMVLGMGMMSGGGSAAMPGGCWMLDSVSHMSAQQRQRMWATHTRMATQMMDGMMANMRAHGAAPSPEWTTLRDSVQRDLAEVPKLQGDSLRSRMQAHAERMHRLMGLQMQAMGMPMGSMRMGCRR
jgi:hypothetical protein